MANALRTSRDGAAGRPRGRLRLRNGRRVGRTRLHPDHRRRDRPLADRGREHHGLHHGSVGGRTAEGLTPVAGRPVRQSPPAVGIDGLHDPRCGTRRRIRTAGSAPALLPRRGPSSAPPRRLADPRQPVPAVRPGPRRGVHVLVAVPGRHSEPRPDGRGRGGALRAPRVDDPCRTGCWGPVASPELVETLGGDPLRRGGDPPHAEQLRGRTLGWRGRRLAGDPRRQTVGHPSRSTVPGDDGRPGLSAPRQAKTPRRPAGGRADGRRHRSHTHPLRGLASPGPR